MRGRAAQGGVVLAGLALAAAPLLAGGYGLYLATEALCWAVAATALALVVGRAGLLPLGAVAPWGVGAYGAALLLGAGVPLLGALALCAALGALAAALGAPLALRAGPAGFALVTLALSQGLYVAADRLVAVTGGTDGRPVPGHPGAAPLYLLALLALGLVIAARLRVEGSPFGHILDAVRQNPLRMRALGYAPLAYPYGAVVLASAGLGLAGGLGAVHRGLVTPGDLNWLHSATLLVMVLLFGARSPWGPALGAATFVVAQALLSSRTPLWALVVGLSLVALAMRPAPRAGAGA